MRHKTLLLAVLCTAAVIATAVVVQRRPKGEPGPPRQDAAQEYRLEPLLKESTSSGRGLAWRLVMSLWRLAREHGLHRLNGIIPGVHADEVYATGVQDGRDRYVVAILRGFGFNIPGKDSQHLLLLDRDGRLLDRLSCSINNRLTRMFVDHGDFRTYVPEAPQQDGACLVIRYIPEDGGSVSGNWSHKITHRGTTNTYAWNDDGPNAIRSADWARQGLCRVGIRNGKFVVLFPGPQGGR
jgi:hypothetical protein